MLNIIFNVFKDNHKIKSTDDSKGKIDFLRCTKLINILLLSENKIYISKEI